MKEKLIVTFKKSQEDIPVLIVCKENEFAFTFSSQSNMKIICTITGDRAVELWNEINGRTKRDESNN